MSSEATAIHPKRRIFCVITQGEEGGAQRFLAQLAQHLNPAAYTMHVVWGRNTGNDLARLLPSSVTHAVARHLVRSISPLHDALAVSELRTMMRAFQPDVVLCLSSKAGFVGSRAAHGLRKQHAQLKVLYRIGGWSFNDPVPAWKKKLYIAMEKLSASWKDVIIVNNTHDLEQAIHLGINPREQRVCVYNGIDAELPFLSRDTARAALQKHTPQDFLSLSSHLIGTIANLYATKGIATLIQAAASTPENTRYVVIGDGPLHQELQHMIATLNIQHRFLLLGRLPDAWKYLRAFDLFVLPSLKEGFPWALLEAMAAKVPAIATRVGAVPEMIEDGVSGIICEPGDEQQISKAIARLTHESDLRTNIAVDAHQTVLSKFTLREMIAQYERILG